MGETTKLMPEATKTILEKARVMLETAKLMPETTKTIPEKTRVMPETARVMLETARVMPETVRVMQVLHSARLMHHIQNWNVNQTKSPLLSLIAHMSKPILMSAVPILVVMLNRIKRKSV